MSTDSSKKPPPGTVKNVRIVASISDGSTLDKRSGEDLTISRDAMHSVDVEVLAENTAKAGQSSGYPRAGYRLASDQTILRPKGSIPNTKILWVPRERPCNIIMVHGVNDVGTGYSSVEAGLCDGLERRLLRPFKSARYRLPVAEDKAKAEDDPDLVFFKRTTEKDTNSPVIPFYWGFREVGKLARTRNGQKTDQYGTRLDKDLSKGGGPFGNATSTLPDMWNRGVYAMFDPMGDPLRPIRTAPGRMYMVLAARRLAALISMIRQYEATDTVNIVAHSQGCLLSLLAQAFLMEMGDRTADTLILTHPPYSLDEEMGVVMEGLTYFKGGKDAAMEAHYPNIEGRQTLHARLQTLVNIVNGVAKSKTADPAFANINEYDCGGMVEARWKPEGDRDNRGKVYLYFCPEDMTVALDNMRGIGWQGVPEYLDGAICKRQPARGYAASHAGGDAWTWVPQRVQRKPLAELGDSFRQRVFTAKSRLDPVRQQAAAVPVGQAPHDFALRVKGEDDHAHVAKAARPMRESLPTAQWPIRADDPLERQRFGIRRITGEPLPKPFHADLRSGQIDADKIPASSRLAKVALKDRGPAEEVDPITAAIAVSAIDLRAWPEDVPDPSGRPHYPDRPLELSAREREQVEVAYNAAKGGTIKNEDDKFTIPHAYRYPNGKVKAMVQEKPNTARLRWQQEYGEKSFHSAIFDSRENHAHVTAYDVSIGSGKASSDPNFYTYLCWVADWRLRNPKTRDRIRQGMPLWEDFLAKFNDYYECEPAWRRSAIKGNVDYYTTSELPKDLPLLNGPIAKIVVSETTMGRVIRPKEGK